MNNFYLIESNGCLRGKFWREKILTTTPEKYIPCSNQDVTKIEMISVEMVAMYLGEGMKMDEKVEL
jgi:hypothetical protein